MAQSRKEVWQEICNEIRRGSAHILITGSRGSGKTTLLERLLKEGMFPGGEKAGIRSFALRNEDGTPSQIILEDRSDGQQQAIAEGFVPGKGPKVKAEVLDHFGVQAIEHAKSASGCWVVIDEVGFLENASPAYCRALLRLFDQKRVAAVLRKKDTVLIDAIRSRTDAVCFDLDDFEKE